MANPTTNYGFVLPTPTDLVTDLPADFDVALQGVDTRLKALQPGTTLGDLAYSSATANTNTRLGIGTSGQVLAVSGGGVPAWTTTADVTPLTTKGDLFTFTTVDARIGVGTNETRLVADSAQATGLKYVADTTNYAIAAKADLLVGTAADTVAALTVGTNGQVLTADSTVSPTGLKWATPASGGKVLQVVQATYATQTNSGSATFADTGLTGTITPTLATSKVLVQIHLPIFKDATSSGTAIGLKLFRGATDIGGSQTLYLRTDSAIKQQNMWSFAYLDSPSTTSATTYKMQFNCITGIGNVSVMVDNNLGTIILTEVGA